MIEQKLENTPKKGKKRIKHHKKKNIKKKKHRRTEVILGAKKWPHGLLSFPINIAVYSYSLGLSPPPSALAAIGLEAIATPSAAAEATMPVATSAVWPLSP